MSSTSGSGGDPSGRGGLPQPHEVDAVARDARLAFFGIEPADGGLLRALRPLADRTVDGIVSQFYAHLTQFPRLRDLLASPADRLQRLQRIQREHFLSLTDAQFDEAYFARRERVGSTHLEVGLEPSWYIGAFALYLRLALRSLVASEGDGARILPTVEALIKSVFLDMSLAMRSYIFGGFVTRAAAAKLEQAASVAEAALREKAETDRLKDELASMVVHDLKNPVNGIMMLVQLALRKGADLPPAHRGYFEQIDLTCREMMRLIQNLLEIAKLEEGRMPVMREVVPLGEVVAEVVADYRSISQQANRPLIVDLAPDLPAALGDRSLVKRIVVNLIVNALRHSGSPDVRIAGSADETSVTLRVIDRGRGVPEALRERIFEKFTSVPRSPADEPGTDTGLGLPFCRLALEEMGGMIRLEPTPGSGTTFTVTLPRAQG